MTIDIILGVFVLANVGALAVAWRRIILRDRKERAFSYENDGQKAA